VQRRCWPAPLHETVAGLLGRPLTSE
jgi:hypothetical protein